MRHNTITVYSIIFIAGSTFIYIHTQILSMKGEWARPVLNYRRTTRKANRLVYIYWYGMMYCRLGGIVVCVRLTASASQTTSPVTLITSQWFTHGVRWSNRTYVALALFSLLSTCVVF